MSKRFVVMAFALLASVSVFAADAKNTQEKS